MRVERQLSLRGVEKRGGPDPNTMSLIERGVRKPHPQTLGKIAMAFGMSLHDLLDDLDGTARVRPPHREWAAAAGDVEFGEWIKTAKASECQKLWNELTEDAEGVEDPARLERLRGRITACIDRFFEVQGLDHAATASAWPDKDPPTYDEGRQAS